MRCPRCERPMEQQRLHAEGGAYRGAYVTVWSCAGCGLTGVNLESVIRDRGAGHARLSHTPLCRSAERTSEACGGCLAPLARLTLSWGQRWVEIEECARCGRLYLDPGELASVSALLEDSAQMPRDSRWIPTEGTAPAPDDGALGGALVALLDRLVGGR